MGHVKLGESEALGRTKVAGSMCHLLFFLMSWPVVNHMSLMCFLMYHWHRTVCEITRESAYLMALASCAHLQQRVLGDVVASLPLRWHLVQPSHLAQQWRGILSRDLLWSGDGMQRTWASNEIDLWLAPGFASNLGQSASPLTDSASSSKKTHNKTNTHTHKKKTRNNDC